MDNSEIKRLLDKIFESLTGNDLGNEGIIPRLNKFTNRVNQVLDEQDKRIAKLEWRQKIMWGIITSVTTAGGAATGVGIWQAIERAAVGG